MFVCFVNSKIGFVLALAVLDIQNVGRKMFQYSTSNQRVETPVRDF